MAKLNNVFPIPTGGAIGLTMTTAVSGNVTLSRATSGSGGLSAFTTLYSGGVMSDTGEPTFYLDLGDQTQGPLLAGTLYVYQLVDVDGTVQSTPVSTPDSVNIEQTQFTEIIIKLIQGAINAAKAGNVFPNGIDYARVMSAMPLSGNFPLPAIFVNPELIKQENVPVGLDDEFVGDMIQPARVNRWTQTQQDRHMFRITVFCNSAIARDYYRDFVIAVLRISVAYSLAKFGAALQHDYMAESYQEVDQTNNMMPGFYACDILFDFIATSNVTVTTSYGLILTKTDTIFDEAGNVIVTAQVPVPSG